MIKPSYLILFYKSYEGRPLNFNRLAGPVIKGDHKMEEVGFSQITGWLLFKMRPSNSDTETEELNSSDKTEII